MGPAPGRMGRPRCEQGHGAGCSPHPLLLFPSERVFGGILPEPVADHSIKRTEPPAVEGVTAHVISNSKPGCPNKHLQPVGIDPNQRRSSPAETRTGVGFPTECAY